jgi:hypothetical protein
MLVHRDRRATKAGSKSGPPALAGRPPKRAGGVASLARATSPRRTLLLPSALRWTITLCKCGRFWV